MIRFYLILATSATISLCLLGAVTGRCPGKYVEVGGGCFLAMTDTAHDFTSARHACQDYGGDLAIVDDCNLLTSLFTYIEGLGFSEILWIGGRDLAAEGQWDWLDGSPVAMGAPFWARVSPHYYSTEPSGGDEENCAVLSVAGGYYFQDINCETYSSYAPLCQAPTLAGSTGSCQPPYVSVGGTTCMLLLSNEYVPWQEARSLCNNNGGDLAIIDDCHLMESVISYAIEQGVGSAEGFWIGGSDEASEGSWTWVDGSSMEMGAPFWGMSGAGDLQPDNYRGSEHCLQLKVTQRFRFNDADCDIEEFPLCQTNHIREEPVN